MNRFRSTLFIVASGLALWALSRDASTQSTDFVYTVTEIATVGGHTNVGLAMSGGGFPTVVGHSQTASGVDHAFSHFVGGSVLEPLRDLGTLGGERSEARAILGPFIVGWAQLPSGLYHAFFYNSFQGPMIDLGTLGGSESWATAVTGGGVVYGASLTGGNAAIRAFVSQNTLMTDLGASLGGPNTVAWGTNVAGHVVGSADLPDGQTYHAFLFANGATFDLGTLGGRSEAFAINSADVVVGWSQVGGGTSRHAFRYESGVMVDLGTLGGASSEALAVNRDGDVVGWAETPQGEQRAFIWRSGMMIDLNTLIPPASGWILQGATAIDERGAVAGYGQFQGQLRAFFLTPPIDLRANLIQHNNLETTNFPNPHTAGQELTFGVTVENLQPYVATGVTVVDSITGPVEIVRWAGSISCAQDGLRLTCRLPPVGGISSRDFFVIVRATGPGVITHTATVTADQPDPSPGNNSGTESNTAVSLATLTLNPTTIGGGDAAVGRVTLTSPSPNGGARVTLASSRPDIASVPFPFDVVGFCCDGLWREFYVTTKPVASPVTVQISATYGLVTRTVPLTIMPAGSQWPFNGSSLAIPGTIELEDFDGGGEGAAYHDESRGNDGNAYRATDVDIEVTEDSGAGWNVGWAEPGDWLEYTVSIAAAGTYTIEARVASPAAGGTFHVEVDGINKTGAMSVPDTGGWQTWTTLSQPVALDAGVHILRLSFDAQGPSGTIGNFNYLRFSRSPSGGPTPIGGTPRAIPGTIEAEDFDEGGEGIAYHDLTAGNEGGGYRATDVDLQPTTDTDGGYNLGWAVAGEWLAYTVNVDATGFYTLQIRLASSTAGGNFHIEVNGVDVTGPLNVGDSRGWQSWFTATRTGIPISAGIHVMRVVMDSDGYSGNVGNFNWIRFTLESP